GTASARRALFRCPCLWRCGRSKPLGAKLVEVVRNFAAHIPFHASGVPRHALPFSARAADIRALRSHRRRAGSGGKALIGAAREIAAELRRLQISHRLVVGNSRARTRTGEARRLRYCRADEVIEKAAVCIARGGVVTL